MPTREWDGGREHELVCAALPSDEGDVAEYLYWTRWRTRRQRASAGRTSTRRPGLSASKRRRAASRAQLPYSVLPELADLIAHRREVTDAVQRKRGMKVNSVFHRNGAHPPLSPLVDDGVYRSGASARKSARPTSSTRRARS
jgi:hypothetical protein